MPNLPHVVPIEHDAPLTEVWCVEQGKRFRIYRGDTQAHIEWKMHEHRAGQRGRDGRPLSHAPELVEVQPPAGTPA